MSDLVLDSVTSGYNLSLINTNFQKIQDRVNDYCLQNKEGNNVMNQALDMNGHALLNLETDFSNNGSIVTVGDAKSHFYQIGLVPDTTNDGDAVNYGQVSQMIRAASLGTDLGNLDNVALYSELASVTGADLVGYQSGVTVGDKLDALDTSVSSLGTSVSSLGTSVSSLDTSVSSLDTSVSSLDMSVSSLDMSVTDLESVTANLPALEESYKDSDLLYRKKLIIDLPSEDPSYDWFLTTYGYGYLYPNCLAIDKEANEIFVCRSGGGGSPTDVLSIISVYELDTGAYKSCFLIDGGDAVQQHEGMVLIKDGSSRYIYINNTDRRFDKYDVTTLPADRATLATSGTFGEDSYAQFAYDGSNWLVMQRVSRVTQQRHIFHIFDKDWNKGAKVLFDRGLFGNISDSTRVNYTPKTQGIAYHKGYIYAGHGGIYALGHSDSYRNDPYRRQGISVHTPHGHCLGVALEDPELRRLQFEAMTGRSCGAVENEGVFSDGENLYSLWNTIGSSQRGTAVAKQGGIVILQELALDGEDFSANARPFTAPFDSERFATIIHRSTTQLKDPITQEELTTFSQIGAMMRDLNIPRYSFYGEGQTLTDNNGNPVDTTSRLFEFVLLNNTDFSVTSYFRDEVIKYVCSTSGVQLGPYTSIITDSDSQVTLPGVLVVAGIVRPDTDNTRTVGIASRRWSTIYSGTGTINTSDAREKTEIKPFSVNEIEAAKEISESFGTFQWLKSVEEKGEDARIHIGQTVQNVMSIMSKYGLDPLRYGFICHDTWTEEDGSTKDRYGFRYDQLIAFAMMGLNARIKELSNG